jgi:hypothetical protein
MPKCKKCNVEYVSPSIEGESTEFQFDDGFCSFKCWKEFDDPIINDELSKHLPKE